MDDTMHLISDRFIRAASLTWRASTGAWVLTLVCNVTYRLAPHRSPVADTQEPPNEVDDYWDDDPACSLRAPTDLVPFKQRADVLLVGHAFAPQGRPVRSLTVRLAVGEMDKSFEVWTDRFFSADGQVREGPPFTKMMLRYERAAGGEDSPNPVGMSFEPGEDRYGRVPIPNFQPSGRHVGWRGDSFEPVCFGPIAPSWPIRSSMLHRHAMRWRHDAWFHEPLPDDVDPAYFNSAPLDQQVQVIRPDESILMENLLRGHERLATRLPGVEPRAVVEVPGRPGEEVRLVCDTLRIDTDSELCVTTWRGRFALRHPQEAGRVLFHLMHDASGGYAAAAHGHPSELMSTWSERRERRGAETLVQPADATVTLAPAMAPSETFPFTRAPTSAAASLSIWERPSRSISTSEQGRDPTQTAIAALAPARCEPLPFKVLASEADPTFTLAPGLEPSAGLPFVAETGNVLAASLFSNTTPGRPLLPPSDDASQTMCAPLDTARPDDVTPFRRDASREPGAARGATTSLELHATLAASIDSAPEQMAKVLAQHGLSVEDWGGADEHWAAAMCEESLRGESALLRRFDEAYIRQIERARGPIQTTEYARLLDAAKNKTIEEASRRLSIPLAAVPRIRRSWTEKITGDGALAAKVRAALMGGG